MMSMFADAEIGGARVKRFFTHGAVGKDFHRGHTMTAEEVLAIQPTNRRALAEQGYIEIWPKPVDAEPINADRHVVHNGGGRYDVIAGAKLNSAALTRDEAEELAKRPN